MPGMRDVLVRHDAGFGAEVAARLAAMLPAARREPLDGPLAADDVPPGGVLVLALDQPAPRLERLADELALSRDAVLVPIAAEHQVVRIGPVLGPGAQATVDCYYRRVRQHYYGTGLTELHAAYDRAAARRTDGYLPSTAAAAAALTAALLRRLADGDRSDLQQVTVLSGLAPRLDRARLTGVHGNARSASPVPRADRSWAALLPLARDLARGLSAIDTAAEGAPR
ncbi:TOMM precursor leader peptide-binding protein [Amycolatopsis sp. VS8301801F10]|uniref:TOMM precursor leader peptide-binding protein n=1 Tax=unclassified Amycolatopsis TaxID=2618356 RepID=UPI0038FCC00F